MDRPAGSETYMVKSTATNPKIWKDTKRQNCVLQKSALARKRQIYITFTRTGLRSGAETILRNINLGQQSGDDPSQKPPGRQSRDDPTQKATETAKRRQPFAKNAEFKVPQADITSAHIYTYRSCSEHQR
ncbi:unnamed protein product [Polarella glacialis]|uniref:Uncharacterized protein n=1 Tax=Polarella glacialis TaxID=89957 RepID=A0A813GC29_POLGL|nr:unnamed protein product [Polarella glacialis]CAE8639499.1 unnamed protein product [Polarella glacialis]